MKLKCKRCVKEWDYDGKKKPNDKYPVYVACPTCRTSVKLEEAE